MLPSPSLFHELKRKAFHLGGIIYAAGAQYLSRPVYIRTMIILVAAAFVIEFLRVRVPAFGAGMNAVFGGVYREKEKSHFSGAFWLMAGAAATALIVEPRALLVTALLYVVLGDFAAGMAGLGLGGARWPRSNKTVIGSTACLLVCLAIGTLLLRPEYGWMGIIASALAATLFEAVSTPVNDNLLMPVAAAVALRLFYG